MRKPKRWLCILLLLLSTQMFVISQPCESLPSGCQCSSWLQGFVQVECVLSAQQDLLTVFHTLNSSFNTTTLHKITVKGCKKGLAVLEPLPHFKIRSLEISSCGLRQVHEKAFDGLADWLEELSLTNNSINTFPFLKKLRKLRVVNLNRNLLKDIPERSFDGLDQLKQLRLTHNRICLLLPNALNETKTSLELLDLSHNCLVTVPAQNLRNSVALTHLDLAANQIGDVAQMQFMNLPKLVELRLSSNRLKGIAPNGFMNVPQLKHFLAQNNLLQQLDGQTLQAFKLLEVIDLSGNSFARIPAFKDHANLVQIHMDSNNIQRLDTLAFSACPKLQLVSVQHNRISTISRNSFDSLAAMTTLNLANNSLEFVERNMFDGVKNLKNLLLQDNVIVHIHTASFNSIPDLVAIDLSGNKLQKIQSATFSKLSKLFFVDLSNNMISTFEKGAFQSRVANIFLDGNQLDCGPEFDWFVSYLVSNTVRTFMPNQPEIACAAPASLVNVRLKELMMKKANETLLSAPPQAQSTSFLAGLIPSLVNGGAAQQPASEQINSVEQAVPSPVKIAGPYLANGQPSSTQISQMLKNMPSMVVNIPGFGAIDISKLPPNVIEHVLRGGQVPGIPADTLAKVVQQYMQHIPEDNGVVRPLSHFPSTVVQGLITASLPDTPQNSNLPNLLSPKVVQMMRLLPPNYNLSKLPPLVMKSVLAGEMPDLSLLPLDLQQYLRDNMDSLFTAFSATPNVSIAEILRKLPRFEQPVLATFSPYDINQIDAELVVGGPASSINPSQMSYAKLYTAIALGMVGATTLVILGLFCYYWRRNRLASTITGHY